MSQDQHWLGAVATSSGLTLAGWVAWRRRPTGRRVRGWAGGLAGPCVAARREPAKQRGEFPLDLDHLGLAGELVARSEEHTSELQSRPHLVCRLLLEKKK